jgi:DNA-binding transcriptional ArsR family regulator
MTPSSIQLDRTFAVLAHPTRRAILAQLARRGPASVTDLAEPFDVSLMAISKHVAVLERAGLVICRREGRVQRCTLDARPLEGASGWIDAYRQFWEPRSTRRVHHHDEPSDPTERA